MKKKILISTGGSGGHVIPAITFCDHLKENFETHLVLIAGLPKSGTTWLEQLLGSTPGLVQLNKSFIRTYPSGHSINLKHSHYVHPDMLNCAPKNLLSFLKLPLDPQ